MPKTCSIEKCTKPTHARGLCGTHYMARKRKLVPGYCTRNAEETREYRKANAQRHADYQATYRKKHGERLQNYYKAWRSENRATYNAYQKSRKSRVRQATPPWADLDAIRDFYFNCPPDHHVDHIIPVNGATVCGLHVLDNLQYLPALDNLRKSNKF